MDDPLPGNDILPSLLHTHQIYLLVFGVVGLVLLLLLSALVSGSEVAYFSLAPDDLKDGHQATTSQRRKKMRYLTARPKQLLATILILNNFINISIVILSTYVTFELFGAAASGGILYTTLTLVVTFLLVLLGEITPKVYAHRNHVAFAGRTAYLLYFSFRLLRPLAYLLVGMSNIIERRIEKKGYTASVDVLKQAIDMTAGQETTEEEKGILKGIVNFGTLSVKQVMKSRVDITAIDVATDFHELIRQVSQTGYSRVPVFKETIDKIEGILYVKDLLPYLNESENFEWQTLLRPGFFVPEFKKIDTLFKDFQDRHVHIAIVVDEYGGTSGLITMEDAIEEIVGEINDEFDEVSQVVYDKLDKNTFVFEGKTSLMDFCKIAHVEPKTFDPVKGESESLGGLLLEINAKLPRVKDKIRFENFVFTIAKADEKKIEQVKVDIQR